MQMDKTLKPLISVVMSVFNSELYVKEAIDSILNQTFEDFEFIILGCHLSCIPQEILLYE